MVDQNNDERSDSFRRMRRGFVSGDSAQKNRQAFLSDNS